MAPCNPACLYHVCCVLVHWTWGYEDCKNCGCCVAALCPYCFHVCFYLCICDSYVLLFLHTVLFVMAQPFCIFSHSHSSCQLRVGQINSFACVALYHGRSRWRNDFRLRNYLEDEEKERPNMITLTSIPSQTVGLMMLTISQPRNEPISMQPQEQP